MVSTHVVTTLGDNPSRPVLQFLQSRCIRPKQNYNNQRTDSFLREFRLSPYIISPWTVERRENVSSRMASNEPYCFSSKEQHELYY